MLFTESPLLDRFGRAAAAGFDTVELWWPAGVSPEAVALAAKRSGVRVDLLNFDAGDMPAGDRGLLSEPDRQGKFRENVPVALELAAETGCRKLNALVGLRREDIEVKRQLDLVRANLEFAAGRAASVGAEILVEAVNTVENGPYLLPLVADAAELLDGLSATNVRLQFDAYHVARMGQDPCEELARHAEQVGHVQIADYPGRGAPGTGVMDFGGIFRTLREIGYRDHVGLEYRPAIPTEETLGWMRDSPVKIDAER